MPPVVLTILVDANKGIVELQSFDKAVQSTTKSTQQGGQSAQQASQGTQAFGASLGASSKNALAFAGALTGIQLGLSAIGNVIQSAVTQVVSFEAAMANVNTLGQRSAEVQQQLRTQILQLPPALGSATELATGLYDVLSSGVEPANAVAFLGEAAALAKAGLAQLDTSVVALTKTMAAYNIPTTQAGEVSDLLFKTVEIGQGSLQQFAGAMPQVVQIAASMGISLKDASNAMATLSQTFKSADTAATGFRSLLSQVIQNNDKFLALGINIKQVIGQEGLLGLVRVLQQVSQGDTGKLKEYVNDIEGLQAAIALTGPQFQTLLKNQKEFENSAGAVDRAVKIQTATVKGSFMELVNALAGLATEISPPFLTAFTRIAQGATQVVTDTRQAFKDFPKIVQEALDNIQKEADKFRAATKDKPLIAFTEEDVGMATLKEFFRALVQGADAMSMTSSAFRKARDEQWRRRRAPASGGMRPSAARRPWRYRTPAWPKTRPNAMARPPPWRTMSRSWRAKKKPTPPCPKPLTSRTPPCRALTRAWKSCAVAGHGRPVISRYASPRCAIIWRPWGKAAPSLQRKYAVRTRRWPRRSRRNLARCRRCSKRHTTSSSLARGRVPAASSRHLRTSVSRRSPRCKSWRPMPWPTSRRSKKPAPRRQKPCWTPGSTSWTRSTRAPFRRCQRASRRPVRT